MSPTRSTCGGPAEDRANVVTRIEGEESIRALVRAGIGLLEERYGREAAADGRLKLLEPAWEIDLGLVDRRDRGDDPAIDALLGAFAASHQSEETVPESA